VFLTVGGLFSIIIHALVPTCRSLTSWISWEKRASLLESLASSFITLLFVALR